MVKQSGNFTYNLVKIIFLLFLLVHIVVYYKYYTSKEFVINNETPSILYKDGFSKYSCELGVVYLKKQPLIDGNNKPKTCSFK